MRVHVAEKSHDDNDDDDDDDDDDDESIYDSSFDEVAGSGIEASKEKETSEELKPNNEQVIVSFQHDQLPESNKNEKKIERTAKLMPHHARLKHNIVFTVAVINVIMICAGFFGNQWFLPYYYTGTFPVLFILRLYFYKKDKWELFLLDFCYFANAMLLVYIWALPDNPYVFIIVFAVSHGPLSIAVIMFRNSLVFHSLDKMTSIFIHVLPSLVLYVIRWYTNVSSIYHHEPFQVCISNSTLVEHDCRLRYNSKTVSGILAFPLAFFVGHMFLYFIIVQGICRKRLEADKEYLTSYRFLLLKRQGMLFKFINCCGRRGRLLLYGVTNVLLCFLTILPSILYFNYFVVHSIFLVVINIILVWNGANFYFKILKQSSR